MIELIQCLNAAGNNDVNLFFLTRNKDPETKAITYNVWASRIQPELAADLKTNGVNQIQGIQTHDHEIIDYGILTQSDRCIVETVDYQCVPYLTEILTKIAQPVQDDNFISADIYPKIWGYIVRIENGNKTLFLFRKYTPKKLLEKDKIACVIDREGQFSKLNGQAIAFDAYYDAALLLQEQTPSSQPEISKIFIFSHGAFESLFSYVDEYRRQIEINQDHLQEKAILENILPLVETCSADTRALKKLAKILVNRSFDPLTSTKIEETIRDFNLPADILNRDRKIQVSIENIWIILRILDDDYGESKATGNKYEMRSKVRK
jgi:hypothetical protein